MWFSNKAAVAHYFLISLPCHFILVLQFIYNIDPAFHSTFLNCDDNKELF